MKILVRYGECEYLEELSPCLPLSGLQVEVQRAVEEGIAVEAIPSIARYHTPGVKVFLVWGADGDERKVVVGRRYAVGTGIYPHYNRGALVNVEAYYPSIAHEDMGVGFQVPKGLTLLEAVNLLEGGWKTALRLGYSQPGALGAILIALPLQVLERLLLG